MLVIGNGRMITQDASNPFLENGAVAMDGNTIVMVGVTEEVKKVYPDAEFVDAKGGVIMPAFINAHEHIYSSFARGLSINGYNPQGFLDILDGLWWTVDRHLTLEQTKLSAYATYIDSIKNGVTTVFDHHASFGHITGSLNAIEEAAKDLGVRTCLCYEISDRDGMEKSRESVMENVNFIKHALADDSDMIAGMMGMHASFTISDETMALCNELKPEGVGYHIHVAEGIYDLHQCLKEHGKRIVDRLHDRTAMDDKCRLCHMAADTSGHNPVKSSQVSAFKPFPAFSSRKRQSTVAVNPFLIVRITFQLFIVLIFKLSEIAFCQFFNNMYRLSRKKNLCCLHASFQRTYINRLNLWIIHLMQKLCSLLT